MTTRWDAEILSVLQQPGRLSSVARVHDAIVCTADQERRLGHITQALANAVVHGAPDGAHQTGAPAAVGELTPVVVKQADIDSRRVVENALDQRLEVAAAHALDDGQ